MHTMQVSRKFHNNCGESVTGEALHENLYGKKLTLLECARNYLAALFGFVKPIQ
jgi:hypothetical protein